MSSQDGPSGPPSIGATPAAPPSHTAARHVDMPTLPETTNLQPAPPVKVDPINADAVASLPKPASASLGKLAGSSGKVPEPKFGNALVPPAGASSSSSPPIVTAGMPTPLGPPIGAAGATGVSTPSVPPDGVPSAPGSLDDTGATGADKPSNAPDSSRKPPPPEPVGVPPSEATGQPPSAGATGAPNSSSPPDGPLDASASSPDVPAEKPAVAAASPDPTSAPDAKDAEDAAAAASAPQGRKLYTDLRERTMGIEKLFDKVCQALMMSCCCTFCFMNLAITFLGVHSVSIEPTSRMTCLVLSTWIEDTPSHLKAADGNNRFTPIVEVLLVGEDAPREATRYGPDSTYGVATKRDAEEYLSHFPIRYEVPCFQFQNGVVKMDPESESDMALPLGIAFLCITIILCCFFCAMLRLKITGRDENFKKVADTSDSVDESPEDNLEAAQPVDVPQGYGGAAHLALMPPGMHMGAPGYMPPQPPQLALPPPMAMLPPPPPSAFPGAPGAMPPMTLPPAFPGAMPPAFPGPPQLPMAGAMPPAFPGPPMAQPPHPMMLALTN